MAQATASCIKANEHYVSYTWWRWKCLNSQTPGSLQKHSRAEDTAVNHNHCGMFVWEVCHCWFSWPTPSFGWMAEHMSTKLKLSTHISVGVPAYYCTPRVGFMLYLVIGHLVNCFHCSAQRRQCIYCHNGFLIFSPIKHNFAFKALRKYLCRPRERLFDYTYILFTCRHYVNFVKFWHLRSH